MKKHITLKQLLFKPGRLAAALTALLLSAVAVSTSAQVLPPSSLPFGLSYQEWSAKWWQWDLEQSTKHLELVGGPSICDGPASRVQFLLGAYLTGGVATQTNKITIPAGTPLFFPILSVWSDNSGCPTFTSFTADELTAQVEGLWSAVSLTSCTIDGSPVAGLSDPTNNVYLVQAPAFSYTTAEHDNVLAGEFGDTCIAGGTTIYPAVADGVFLMLSPLSPGKHVIHAIGKVGPLTDPFVEEDITYEITVSRDSGCDGR